VDAPPSEDEFSLAFGEIMAVNAHLHWSDSSWLAWCHTRNSRCVHQGGQGRGVPKTAAHANTTIHKVGADDGDEVPTQRASHGRDQVMYLNLPVELEARPTEVRPLASSSAQAHIDYADRMQRGSAKDVGAIQGAGNGWC
jgi:hypothetical protein